jgi:hypothetical protein
MYVPSGFCPSAPEPADSISAASWRSRMLESSAWSRGKPSAARSWLRRWTRDSWTKRLFGRILPPSTASLGVAAFIASLGAIPARESRWPGEDWAPTIPDGCGPTSGGSSKRSIRNGASSRTSDLTYLVPSGTSPETFKGWVTALRRGCLQRQKSARLIFENGFSFWPTPSVPNGGRSPRPDYMTEMGRMADGTHRTVHLEERVRMWPTPQALDGIKSPKFHKGGNPSLPHAAKMWPTPSARDGRSGLCSQETAERNARPLNEFVVSMWATPRASDGEKGGPNMAFGAGGTPLPAQAVQFQRSLPVPTTSSTGSGSSKVIRSLNPLFVEWLMGWPIGWTASAPGATEWSRWLRPMRCSLSAMRSRNPEGSSGS